MKLNGPCKTEYLTYKQICALVNPEKATKIRQSFKDLTDKELEKYLIELQNTKHNIDLCLHLRTSFESKCIYTRDLGHLNHLITKIKQAQKYLLTIKKIIDFIEKRGGVGVVIQPQLKRIIKQDEIKYIKHIDKINNEMLKNFI